MEWIHRFQLFLFDFDGLLVNTEHLHYQAYINVLDKRGYKLSLSFANFLELAHLNATAWREAMYLEFPTLPDWSVLYPEKKEEYLALCKTGKVELMPGVACLLKALGDAGIRRCVVTHSPFEQIKAIRAHLEPLSTISHWITREDYELPKPNPECYLKAIALYGKQGDKIIGFEDSVRGLQALKGTPALPVLVCSSHHPLLSIAKEGTIHVDSLESLELDRSLA